MKTITIDVKEQAELRISHVLKN